MHLRRTLIFGRERLRCLLARYLFNSIVESFKRLPKSFGYFK
ncbi:hypothetical protein [Saccharibacillus sp. O23]|nr:hypothetical protein [Saccharibacillus sp. O23]